MQFSRKLPTPTEPPIEWLLRPFQRFSKRQASGGIVLFICAVVGLIWANTPWMESYEHLWETHLAIGFGDFLIDEPIHFWINDFLMAVFFFMVGLEIKRELLVGELASPRRAALPAIAAIGGMVVPAAIYLAFTVGREGAGGWGIPMATDIAFALGVMALLGKRVPLSLKIFLAALAIVDDVGGVLVIAIVYTDELVWLNLGIAGGFVAALALANWVGVRNPLVFAALGAAVWFAILKSGIHASVAGVIIATAIPSRVKVDSSEFLERGRVLMDEFERHDLPQPLPTTKQRDVIHGMETMTRDAESPLERLEHMLNPWVAFIIVPLFALSNVGISLGSGVGESVTSPVFLGVVFGLIVGKLVGISLFTWLAVRSGIAALPAGVTWRHIFGVALLGGIGFTVSLFVTGLAFEPGELVNDAKIGILIASVIGGALGWFILSRQSRSTLSETSEVEHASHA
ncbi:MAG: Na+/H+ antiporter NhaA [Chloroflexi bacterium]|nr:Na+/H+ antiporter NhaA [Chloroflexota bacterium]